MTASLYRKAADLPEIIPVFPLDGALLLPTGALPLNIFEPRYLNMVDDAFSGARIIGMVQTRGPGESGEPLLEDVGCAGRITSYAETEDGRYLITLTGVCRFGIAHETKATTPYRQVKTDFKRFEHDLAGDADFPADFDRTALLTALRTYLEAGDMTTEWSALEKTPANTLVNSLCMMCPFERAEKQALLEAGDLADRLDALMALLEMGAANAEGGLQ